MEPTQFKPALLQAYPLGTLEVEYTGHTGLVFRCLLIGLNKSHARLMHLDTSISRVKYCSVSIQDVTPALRPFRALTTRLADGTVPAVEVAKLLTGGEPDEYTYEVSNSQYGGGFTVEGSIDGELVYVLDLRPDWTWFISDLLAEANHEEIEVKQPAAIIDYLRRHLFALPVCGQPLQEGTDYIAKED